MIGLTRQTVTVGTRTILRDVTFAPRPGALTALCGPNGAGKTTLLRALAGLLPHMSPGIARPDPTRVVYLPQSARSAWGLTVRQIAELGRIPHGDRRPEPVDRALHLCGVEALRDTRIDRISGGEMRRAMLARAFATEPEVFLLDEPTADLDPAAAHDVMGLLRRTADAGSAVVVVLHAIDLALRYADRVVLLRDGRIEADVPASQALPKAAALFGLPYGLDPTPRLLPPD